MKNIGRKILSLILAILMSVSCLPFTVMAEQVIEEGDVSGTVPGHNVRSDSGTLAEAVMEEVEKRTENTKYIRLTDGSHYVAQYENAVHYQDESGLWQEIDNTLISSAAADEDDISGYETSNVKRSIKFANHAGSSKLLTVKDDKYKISFGLMGANGVKGAVVTDTQEEETSVSKLEQLTIVKKNISSVIYEDILDNVDLQYIVIGNQVKENIIVKKTAASYRYSFTLKLNRLYAEMQENGTVGLFDDKTDEQQYVIPSPYMYDANGNYSAAVCLEETVIILACIIYSLFASSLPSVDVTASAVTQVWTYIGELLFNMLVLVGTIKLSDRVIKEMMGL